MAQTMFHSDVYRLLGMAKIFKKVRDKKKVVDSHVSFRVAKKLWTVTSVSDCQDNHSQSFNQSISHSVLLFKLQMSFSTTEYLELLSS